MATTSCVWQRHSPQPDAPSAPPAHPEGTGTTPMRIAMIGTRGVPARYGGFETAVEEVGSRLFKAGHEVTVYCRGDDRSSEYLGMKRVRLPAVSHPIMETLSHTALSVAHLVAHRTDVAIVFNAANALLLPLIKAAGIPVAVHVDGLEWKRAKWGPMGRRYYLATERLAVAVADELIADAVGIKNYYRERYGADSVFIPYGATLLDTCDTSRLRELNLSPDGYHLVVARLEPENHVDLIIKGYRQSNVGKPLVVVGSVPYPSPHERLVSEMAAADSRIRMLGSVWDVGLLNALYAGSSTYLHGHSVGGTNPSLLRAMGAASDIIALDVVFNREVVGTSGRFFRTATELTELLNAAKATLEGQHQRRAGVRTRAEREYRWDDVAGSYEQLCRRLADREHRTRISRPTEITAGP